MVEMRLGCQLHDTMKLLFTSEDDHVRGWPRPGTWQVPPRPERILDRDGVVKPVFSMWSFSVGFWRRFVVLFGCPFWTIGFLCFVVRIVVGSSKVANVRCGGFRWWVLCVLWRIVVEKFFGILDMRCRKILRVNIVFYMKKNWLKKNRINLRIFVLKKINRYIFWIYY